MKIPTIECDVMLLGWSETHSGGAKITLQLSDVAELEPFKSMTLKKGKHAGQLLKAVFVEVDGNGEPVQEGEKKRAGGEIPQGYCGLAVRWCGEPYFYEWLGQNYPDQVLQAGSILGVENGRVSMSEISAWALKKVLGIASRSEIDTDDLARAAFDTQIRQPYTAYRKEIGLE